MCGDDFEAVVVTYVCNVALNHHQLTFCIHLGAAETCCKHNRHINFKRNGVTFFGKYTHSLSCWELDERIDSTLMTSQ